MTPRRRLMAIPCDPGTWGEALASGVSGWLALGLVVPQEWTTPSDALLVLIEEFGRPFCVAWLILATILPFISIAFGSVAFRVVTAGVTMFSWSVLAALSIWHHGVFAPHVGMYLVCILAMVASEYRLTRDGSAAEVEWTDQKR